MSPKILIVDDEPGIVTVVKNYFEMTGYQVLTAGNGTDAMKQLTKTPDLVLLDINMPDIDGLTVCRKIREHITCPILFLTARIEISDKVQGFLAGADDYIVKPFDLDELGARVAAHLRREHRKQEQSILRFFGDMVIDYSKREILITKKPILLSKKEFDIVELLTRNPGQVFDKERIYEVIWGYDSEGNSSIIVEHMRRIRKKFMEYTEKTYIETVWGIGYKWEN